MLFQLLIFSETWPAVYHCKEVLLTKLKYTALSTVISSNI